MVATPYAMELYLALPYYGTAWSSENIRTCYMEYCLAPLMDHEQSQRDRHEGSNTIASAEDVSDFPPVVAKQSKGNETPPDDYASHVPPSLPFVIKIRVSRACKVKRTRRQQINSIYWPSTTDDRPPNTEHNANEPAKFAFVNNLLLSLDVSK